MIKFAAYYYNKAVEWGSEDGKYCIKSLGEQDASRQANFHGIIQDITVLGCEERPVWNRTGEGLLLETSCRSDKPIVFKLKIV